MAAGLAACNKSRKHEHFGDTVPQLNQRERFRDRFHLMRPFPQPLPRILSPDDTLFATVLRYFCLAPPLRRAANLKPDPMKPHPTLWMLLACCLASCMDEEPKAPYFAHVEQVAFASPTLSIKRTAQTRLELIFTPEDAGNKTVTWFNSAPEVASLTSNGLLTALEEGTTVISVETADMHKRASVSVTVTKFVADIPLTLLEFDRTAHDFAVTDAPLTLRVTREPADASMPELQWSTTDRYVASVEEGVITPVGHGTAVIRAQAVDGSDLEATCTVRVDGIKDRNYDLEGGINADGYYKIIYYPIDVEVTLDDGTKATQTWLDRNLGAKRAAASYDDFQAFGSLFQWSRKADGHEKVVWSRADGKIKASPSGKTAANERCTDRSNTGHADFVVVTASDSKDWASDPASDALGLWGALGNGTDTHAPLEDEHHANNPCPAGYRIPTTVELQRLAIAVLGRNIAVSGTTAVTGARAAFGSHPVRMTFPGERTWNTGNVGSIGTRGVYWTNVPAALTGGVPNNATRFFMEDTRILPGQAQRSMGYSVRCIRD